jgi:hypothetical protein
MVSVIEKCNTESNGLHTCAKVKYKKYFIPAHDMRTAQESRWAATY